MTLHLTHSSKTAFAPNAILTKSLSLGEALPMTELCAQCKLPSINIQAPPGPPNSEHLHALMLVTNKAVSVKTQLIKEYIDGA